MWMLDDMKYIIDFESRLFCSWTRTSILTFSHSVLHRFSCCCGNKKQKYFMLIKVWRFRVYIHFKPNFRMIFLNANPGTTIQRETYLNGRAHSFWTIFTYRVKILIKRPASISATFSFMHFITELTIFYILCWFRSIVVTDTCAFPKTIPGAFNLWMNRITGYNISWWQWRTCFFWKIIIRIKWDV